MSVKKVSYGAIYFCIFCLIIAMLIMVTISIKSTYSASDSSDNCSKEAVLQLAKIIYSEVGADCADNPNENFFMRLTTASIVLNNANRKSGATWYNKIYNLTNNNYQGYSTYKDKSFENVVKANQNEILYIAQLVFSGRYNVPTNMTLQASPEIVERWGTVWDRVYTKDGFYDTFFGYENSLNNTDVFGNTISDTSTTYYRNLADSLKLDDYSMYTVDNVCNINSSNHDGSSSSQPSSSLPVSSSDPSDSSNDDVVVNSSSQSMTDSSSTDEFNDTNNNQNVDENAQTGDSYLLVISLVLIALSVSIYYYKVGFINDNY